MLRVGQQAGARRLEVVIVAERTCPGGTPAGSPAQDDVILAVIAGAHDVLVADRGRRWAGLMRRGPVGQNQDVLAFLVAEEEEDALLLQKPQNEVEGRLAVLDAVLPGIVGPLELDFEVLETEVLKNLLDDVRDVLVLEDPAVGGAREEPQSRGPRPPGSEPAGPRPAIARTGSQTR